MSNPEDRYSQLPEQPKGLGPNGRPFCRRCGQEVPPGRRKWCGKKCIDEHLIRSSATGARAALWKRDRGVCRVCKLDTHRLGAAISRAGSVAERWSYRHHAWRVPMALRREFWHPDPHDFIRHMALSAHGYAWGHSQTLWEADHINPVKEGGGQCGIENLRILCVPCHRRITAIGARRRALMARRRKGGDLFETIPTEENDLALKIRRGRRGRVPRGKDPIWAPPKSRTPRTPQPRAEQLKIKS